MTSEHNRIVREHLTVSETFIVKGDVILVNEEGGLDQIDDLHTYIPISGDYETLTIEGNLIVCKYDERCVVILNGYVDYGNYKTIN